MILPVNGGMTLAAVEEEVLTSPMPQPVRVAAESALRRARAVRAETELSEWPAKRPADAMRMGGFLSERVN
jgi:hypothetical protein